MSANPTFGKMFDKMKAAHPQRWITWITSIAMAMATLLTLRLSAQQKPLTITHLADSVYVFTTWRTLDTGPYPANGVYVTTPSGAVMIDTPWDTTQFQPLLDSIMARHSLPVKLVLSTHFHDDRTAGLPFFKEMGIPTYSYRKTYELCASRGEPQSAFFFLRDTTFMEGGILFRASHEGAGHTADNIVVWLPQFRLLVGGCLVKSLENDGIGHTSDADLPAWERTMRRVIRNYPRVRWVVPGHYSCGGRKTLRHTLKVVRRALNDPADNHLVK